MKKIITLLVLLSALPLYSQQVIPGKVQELLDKKIPFKQFSPLAASNAPVRADDVVTDAQYAVVNPGTVKDIAAAGYKAIELSIPYNNTIITTQLYRVDILAEGFHVDTDKQKSVEWQKGSYYRGIVKGDPKSVVSFNFFENEMNGIISNEALQNLVVAPLEQKGNTSDYIIYSDANLKVLNNFNCGTQDPEAVKHNHQHRDGTGEHSTRCVTTYFEVDYNIYQLKMSNITTTTNWMTSVFNNVQTLYANDGISIALRSVFVWTTPDPYTGSSSGDYLMQFHQVRPVFDGNVGQLVGIDPGGLGGVAVTIGGVCSDYNFSYSDVDITYSSVPVFSWTVQVITHELGHLLGSPHTHGCYWNGNNTAIDGCGSSQGYVEGNCPQGPIPSPAVKGTIMSYCHLVPNIGIKFSNGFGPQPAARILSHVESSLCLSTDCINTCINGIADIAVDSSLNGATIAWNDISSFGPWEVSVVPFSSAIFTNWQTVAMSSHTVGGLSANTYYKIAIRPLCNTGVTAATREFIFMTDGNFCSGLQFTDTGGTTGQYTDEQHLIRTITPDVAGAKAKITFTSFFTEDEYDYLYVYNGPDTNAPLLGVFTGFANPGTFTSTAPDGSLTIKFTSDEGVTSLGWNATISCTALGTTDNSLINFTYYPNPARTSVNLKAGEQMDEVVVYNVAGQLLLNKAVNAAETAVDISSFAEGVYFFKVTGNGKEANFRIVKQD